MGVFEKRKSLRRLFGEFLREETVSSFFCQSKSSTTQKVNCQYRTILPIKPANMFYEHNPRLKEWRSAIEVLETQWETSENSERCKTLERFYTKEL